MNPKIMKMNGMITVFFKSKTVSRYSSSPLIFIKYLFMKNRIMSIKIKSRPYSDSLNREFGLLATNIVKYGINEITNIKNMFIQITLESIFSTWEYIT